MKGCYISGRGAIQGHHGPLVNAIAHKLEGSGERLQSHHGPLVLFLQEYESNASFGWANHTA